jgi:2-dehydro-3-deoxyphosphogluconate aldolase/(4S)-4-hydroxy-2-oxoglutarate aldolase
MDLPRTAAGKTATLERIRDIGLIAVLRGPSEDATLRTVEALVAGGVRAIEITFGTPNAAHVARALDRQLGDEIVLGMGTLTEPEQAMEARDAGVRFLVSPICDEALATAMVGTGLAVMVGALTPTEVHRASRLGSDMVKIFPGSLVGPGYIRALRGPLPQLALVPTGGVSPDNVGAWFASGVAAVGAGGELCPRPAMAAGRFGEITLRAREFVAAVGRARAGECA